MFYNKKRLGDGKINTPEELIEVDNERVWDHDPIEALKYESLERRKILNWIARMILSLVIFGTFIFFFWLLFYAELPQGSRDLVNIMIGAFVATVAKTGDYWFKSDDNESKENAELYRRRKLKKEDSE